MQHTIIIPTHQRKQLLERALRSLLNQTFSDFEVIVVDDGSTDGTREMVQALARSDCRFKYHYLPKSCIGKVRNKGVEMASGEWLHFLDSDDEFSADNLAVKVRHIAEHDYCDFFIGNVQLIGDAWLVDKNDFRRKINFNLACPNLGRWFIKKEFLMACGGFGEDKSYAEDTELMERIVTKINVWPLFVAERIYRYYRDGHLQLTSDPSLFCSSQ